MRTRGLLVSGLVVCSVVLLAGSARAIPSFARQTALSCNSCHMGFPKLNAFGRLFKLNAYTLTGITSIESAGNNNPRLKLTSFMPISATVQTSFTTLRTAVPGERRSDVEFPQQLSFFIAAEITPNLGTFIQATYEDQTKQFSWDDTDIRFATKVRLGKKNAIVGLTLNNNPTVQDVWNTAPAWSFPYASTGVAAALPTTAITAGQLAQQVAGLGAYIFYDNLAYGEFSLYASTPQGGPHPADGTSNDTLSGLSPYWRLALQHNLGGTRYVSAGTYGFYGRLYPEGIVGPTDRYTDIAFDLQYEQSLGRGGINVYANYVHESRDLLATYAAGGVAAPKGDVESFRANAAFIFRNTYSLTLGFFAVDGSADPILYVPGSVSGSRRHQPNGTGLIIEASLYAWQNTMLALQYTLYTRFNGARFDYDGFGRNASDNNSLYLLLWIAF